MCKHLKSELKASGFKSLCSYQKLRGKIDTNCYTQDTCYTRDTFPTLMVIIISNAFLM